MDLKTIIDKFGGEYYNINYDQNKKLFIQIPKDKTIIGQSQIFNYAGKLVCADIGITKKIKQDEIENIKDFLKDDIVYKYAPILNGVTIRAYWYNNKWNYTTSNMIDINDNTRISNKIINEKIEQHSLLEVFKKEFTIPNKIKLSNKRYTYFFTFYSPNLINYIIYGKKVLVKYLGYVDLDSDDKMFNTKTIVKSKLEPILNRLTCERCGLIVFKKNINYMLFSKSYENRLKILCDSNNLYYCILNVIIKGYDSTFIKYYSAYWIKIYNNIKDTLYKYVMEIYNDYIFNYLKNKEVNNLLMCEIMHEIYINTKINITIGMVKKRLYTLPVSFIANQLGIEIKLRN